MLILVRQWINGTPICLLSLSCSHLFLNQHAHLTFRVYPWSSKTGSKIMGELIVVSLNNEYCFEVFMNFLINWNFVPDLIGRALLLIVSLSIHYKNKVDKGALHESLLGWGAVQIRGKKDVLKMFSILIPQLQRGYLNFYKKNVKNDVTNLTL